MNDVNLKAWFDKYKSSHQFKIDEKISALKIRITFSSSDRSDYLFADLFDELSKIPSRDSFSLEITKGVDDGKVFLTADASNQAELLECLQNTINLDEPFEVLLVVDKKCVNGFLSVYFIEELDEYFLCRNVLNIIRELSVYIKDGIHFVVFSPLKRYGSKTIYFSPPPPDGAPIYINHLKRSKIINIFKDSASFLGYEDFASKLLPVDFYTDEDIDFLGIKSFFDKAFLILSFAFLANQSEVKKIDENTYCFFAKIHGYKAIDIDIFECDEGKISFPVLYKIYDWVYQSEAGNPVEKIGLVRNLVSLHTSEKEEVVIDDVLWQAIKSNYKVYLKENVELYLDAKGKIADALTSSVEKTQDLVEGVIGSIRAAIGVLVTFLLTVVLINGFKDIGEALKTFSIPYFIIVLLISICAFYWVRYSTEDARNRFEDSSKNIKDIIISSYKNVLLPKEIEDATDKVSADNLVYLNKYIDKYNKFWRNFLLVFCGLYFLGTLVYLNRYDIFRLMKSILASLLGGSEV